MHFNASTHNPIILTNLYLLVYTHIRHVVQKVYFKLVSFSKRILCCRMAIPLGKRFMLCRTIKNTQSCGMYLP